MPDLRAVTVVLGVCVAVGGVVLGAYGPGGDGVAETAAVLAVLLRVTRPPGPRPARCPDAAP